MVIVVNALDPEAARPFNKVTVNVAQDMVDARGRERVLTYRVDSEGNINFLNTKNEMNNTEIKVTGKIKYNKNFKAPLPDFFTVSNHLHINFYLQENANAYEKQTALP